MSEKGFLGKIIGIIKSPRRGFDDIDEGDLWKGVLIILLIAVLAAVAGMAYTSKIDVNILASRMAGAQGAIEVDPQTLKDSLVTIAGVANGVGAITKWLFMSLLLVLVAKLLVGGGSTRRMFTMTGFASTPLIVQQVLRLIDARIVSSLELAAMMASKATAANLVMKFLNQALNVLHVFGILTLVLTVFAVSTNYGTTIRRASYVTLVAYAAYILLKVFLPI